jgi:hypothetical protein
MYFDGRLDEPPIWGSEEVVRAAARQVLERAVALAQETSPDLRCEVHLVERDTCEALAEFSRHAVLTVCCSASAVSNLSALRPQGHALHADVAAVVRGKGVPAGMSGGRWRDHGPSTGRVITVDFGLGPERSLSLSCDVGEGVAPLDARFPLSVQVSAFPHSPDYGVTPAV